MNKITGNGKPTNHTPGEVGQYYEDLETGDIYECRRSSEFSPLHGAPVGGYIWELRMRGEDRREHGEILGGYAISTICIRHMFNPQLMADMYIATATYSEFSTVFTDDVTHARAVYMDSPMSSDNKQYIMQALNALSIERYIPLSDDAAEYILFTFRKPDGTVFQLQFNPDDTIVKLDS